MNLVHRAAITRPPLRFPGHDGGPAALLRLADRLQAQADAAYEAALSHATFDAAWYASIDWQRHRAELAHPLSSICVGKGGRREGGRDTQAEYAAYLSARGLLIDALAAPDGDGFVQSLCQAAASLCPEVGGRLRATPVGLVPLNDGVRVQFGPAAEVRDRLAELHADYRACAWPTAVRAVTAMAVLLNIHPFMDGNGRCARALFNAALRGDVTSAPSNGAPPQADTQFIARCAYVPLHDALLASDAGFEIRLRDAEINANWAPLFGYFRTVFSAMADAHAGVSPPDSKSF